MSGVPQKRKRVDRRYCSYWLCTSNTADVVEGVKMLSFPKPCKEFFLTCVDDSYEHAAKQCPQCSKCLRWIILCRRADARLGGLVDISKHTYICTKHFANGLGPTEVNPDPLPAEKIERKQKSARKVPNDRSLISPLIKVEKVEKVYTNLAEKESKNTFPININDGNPEEYNNVTDCDSTSKFNAYQDERQDPFPIDTNDGHPEEFTNVIGCYSTSKSNAYQDEQQDPFIKQLEINASNVRSDFPVPVISTNSSCLQKIGQLMYENNFNVHFDGEKLSASIFHGHLVKKSCVIDQAMNVQIYVLGRPINQNHAIWKTYPKVWDLHFDYLSFLEDIFENWNICCTSIEKDKLRRIKEKIKNSDPYLIDLVTDTVRSIDCELITPRRVCLSCKTIVSTLHKKFRNRPEIVRAKKICSLTKEEAQTQLRLTIKKFKYEKHKNKRHALKIQQLIRRGTKVTNADNLDLLET